MGNSEENFIMWKKKCMRHSNLISITYEIIHWSIYNVSIRMIFNRMKWKRRFWGGNICICGVDLERGDERDASAGCPSHRYWPVSKCFGQDKLVSFLRSIFPSCISSSSPWSKILNMTKYFSATAEMTGWKWWQNHQHWQMMTRRIENLHCDTGNLHNVSLQLKIGRKENKNEKKKKIPAPYGLWYDLTNFPFFVFLF